jgi:hypothetical protein
VSKAAIGFRAHTGWAAAVALIGPPAAPRVVDRRRIDLLSTGVPWECYHAAARMPVAKAEAMIENARATATDLARVALGSMQAELATMRGDLSAIGVVLSKARPLLSLDEALSSHAMKHAAEGQLYRQALIDAASDLGVRVIAMPERELADAAATTLDVAARDVRGRVEALGRELGPPWTLDQKSAALVAWLALGSKGGGRRG